MAVKSLSQSTVRQAPPVNSLLAGYQGNQFHHLETIRLGSAAAFVQFTNLARYADYQHLQLRSVSQDGRASANNSPIRLRFNGDTSSNYNFHGLDANGNSVTSYGEANSYIWITGGNSQVGFGGSVVDFLDPYDTSKNKTIRAFGGTSGAAFSSETGKTVGLQSGLWRSTAAITAIEIAPFSGSFAAGSRFSLYGIKARA